MLPKALYILNSSSFNLIYGPQEQMDIASMCDVYAPPQTADVIKTNPSLLYDAEIIFSGWGAPCMDETFLNAAPNLKAVFYGAGSLKNLVTDAFWKRDIIVTSSWGANGIPVSEFALAEILFSLKLGWYYASAYKQAGKRPVRRDVPGIYGSTVALISLGMIGKMTARLLKNFEVKVIAYDPYASKEAAEAEGVELVTLDDAFARADVISLHTPWLKETENMIQARHFRLMKQNATFINTARGAVVDEKGMIEVLSERQDLTAVLDVTYPEPPVADSPLYTLPNVVLTPHIAGSMNDECRRMGRFAIEECRRYLNGEELKWQVTQKMAATLA